jgi:hypothetical protein
VKYNSGQLIDWPVSPSTWAAASRALSGFAGVVGFGELPAVVVIVSSAGRGVSIRDEPAVASAAASAAGAATAGVAGVSAAAVRTRSAGADASRGRFSVLATLRLSILCARRQVAWVVFFLAVMSYLLRFVVRARDAAAVATSPAPSTVTSDRTADQGK